MIRDILLCRLHSQLPLPSLLSFTSLLDPQSVQILSHSSSHRLQSLSLPRPRYFSPQLFPPIILLSLFLTPQLSCCFFFYLHPWFSLSHCLFPPFNQLSFSSSSHLFFFFQRLYPLAKGEVWD